MSSDILTDQDKKVLDVELRRKVYLTVSQYAGSHFREIERLSGIATGSLQYHLDCLVKQGLIRVEKDTATRYFPRDFTVSSQVLMGLLRQKNVRDILLYILSHDKCNHEHIVSAVSLSASTVSFHLQKLLNENIVKVSRKGRKSFYSLLVDKKEVMNLLVTYRSSFVDSLVDNIVSMWDVS